MTLVALLFSTKYFFDAIDHVSSFTCYRSCLLNKRRKRKKTEKITQNTFIVVLSVFKFVLANLQKECLITHY